MSKSRDIKEEEKIEKSSSSAESNIDNKNKDEKILDDVETQKEDDEISKLTKELELKESENQEYLSQIQRLHADFDNFKKQTAKKEANIVKYANETLIIKILDVYEDLERAIESCKTPEDYEKGLNLIYSKFDNILKGEGLECIETSDKKFDPFKHEAMMVEDNPDYEDKDIIDELAKGYSLKDKVIKYSKVRVCKRK